MIGPDDERRRPAAVPGFADAVTYAWSDRARAVHGVLRVGLAEGGVSLLAVLFAGREPVAAVARGGLAPSGGAEWERMGAPGLELRTEAPLEAWTVAADVEGHRVELRFEAAGPPAEVAGDEALARLGGMAGYEQACRVRGRIRGGARDVEVSGVGQRGHQWGAPDWDRLSLARTVTVWDDDARGVALCAVRPAAADAHDREAVWAALLEPGGAARVADPRLSTTYDGDGRQQRAGLELWIADDDPYPLRAGGEVLCGSSLDLGRLRLDCAFFAWRLEGRDGVGRYDVLRPA